MIMKFLEAPVTVQNCRSQLLMCRWQSSTYRSRKYHIWFCRSAVVFLYFNK